MRRFLLGAVVWLAVSGCASTGAPRDPDLHFERYVALGDSYTSGPGISPMDAAAGLCQRSKANYPALLARRIGADLTDVSCGGATTAHVLTTPQAASGVTTAQIAAVTTDTDLVTISIGANDGFTTPLFFQCAFSRTPAQTCAAFVQTSLPQILPHIRTTVGATLDQIEQQAPNATIVLVGYMSFASGEQTCDALPLPSEAIASMHSAEQQLEQLLSEVADLHQVTFVPMGRRSDGHDPCSDHPWTNGTSAVPYNGSWLHPRRAGMEATADAIIDALS